MSARCRVALAIASLCWGALPLADAWAHAKLVRSDPAARSVLKRAPTHVRLWFNEKLEAAFSSAEVRDAAGARVNSEPAIQSAQQPKLIELRLPVLKDGTYTVHYRVLSVDGHVVQANYRFVVRAASP